MTPPNPAFKRKVKRAVRMAKPAPEPEDDIHKKLVALLRAAGVAFFHVANERRTSERQGAHLKAMGVSAGVPDLVIVTPPPCGGYVAAALEVKREGGRLSDLQRAWLLTMRSCEWAVACEYGFDACVARLKEWGYL